MPKRRTRKEKIESDHRRQLSFGQKATFSYKIVPKNQEQPLLVTPTKTVLYPYLRADLKKTTLLTLSIIVIQFALYFFLRNHIFFLPGLIY